MYPYRHGGTGYSPLAMYLLYYLIYYKALGLGDEVVPTGFEIKRVYTLFLYRYDGTGYTT